MKQTKSKSMPSGEEGSENTLVDVQSTKTLSWASAGIFPDWAKFEIESAD